MESCCWDTHQHAICKPGFGGQAYGNFHSLTSHKLHGAHDILLHLHQLRELLCEVWAEGTGGGFTECMAYTTSEEGTSACNIKASASVYE